MDNKMKITIVLRFKGVEKLWNIWAESESEIDFRKNDFEAEHCTASFAALELKKFLLKMDFNLTVDVSSSRPLKNRFVELKIEKKDTYGGFSIIPQRKGIVIAGDDRNGLLNGVYEFLRLQGWDWVEPGARGECPPENKDIKWPEREIIAVPSFRYRGIDAYRESQDSVEYMLWMARNRMNVCFRKAATGKFSDKLGMFSRTGGHLLQRLLKPDIYLENGKTIWENHPEWYGLPENGKREKEKATRIQLCVSQDSLLAYLGNELVKMLNGPMSEIDIVDIWGFDTWGKTCSCRACRKIGNGADQNLLLLSKLRSRLDKACETGELGRKVSMDTVAYEGTVTLEGPTGTVPENIVKAGDICIFYPIRRCYRHGLDDCNCNINKSYSDALRSWNGRKSLCLWAGEYYNVSKYEDLPLLFTEKIPNDMRFYYSEGAKGATYMHAIFVNWGMRSLTQMQHAQYAWDINTDDEKFLENYFSKRYGIYAPEMRKAYELIETASRDISAWRNWRVGVLDKIMSWDGGIPGKQLEFGHFKTVNEAIGAARKAAENMEAAYNIIGGLIKKEQTVNCKILPKPDYIPVNPQELEAFTLFDKMEYRLAESRRLLVYGIDTMRLLTALMEYHDDLYKHKLRSAQRHWNTIESIAEKMALYFMPMSFENSGPGLRSLDALTRTQLRPVITRCRAILKKTYSAHSL